MWCTVEAMEFHGVDEDVKIKIEYETYEDLGLNPHPLSDWKLNPKCRVILRRLQSKIMKKEYEGNLEGTNSEEPSLFPEHLNHFLTIQRNIKEEPDDVEEYDKDPLGDIKPVEEWKYFSATTNLQAKTTETDANEKPFKCESCEEIFSCSSDLNKHKSCHQSGDKHHKCETCGKCFTRSWSLKRHMTCHVSIKLFKCGSCEKIFSCSSDLTKHKSCHHSVDQNKPHMCKRCGTRFTRTSSLKRHMTCHVSDSSQDIKSFKCESCVKTFSCLRYLKSHQMIHTGVRRFKCNVCEKCFFRLPTLKRHVECRHTTDKPFKCGECGKEFASTYLLDKHMVCHTKPHKCNECEESFGTRSNLKGHMETHRRLHTRENQ